MAIEFVGSATATANNGGNPAVDLTALTGGIDTAARENDLVVAFGAVPTNTAGIDWSGYTLIDENVNSASTGRSALYYKFMTSTPDTSATFTGDGDANSSVGALAMVFRGVDTSTPIDVAATAATGSSTNPDPPAITAPATAEAVVAVFAFSRVNDAAITAPTNYSDITIANAGGDTNDVSLAAAWRGGFCIGEAENPAAFTNWSTGSWRAISVVLRPIARKIVFVGSVTNITLDGSDPVLDLTALANGIASSPSEGDLVVICGGFNSASNVAASVITSGYTLPVQQSNGNTRHVVGYKVMGASPDTTVTGEGSGDAARGSAYVAQVYRNVDPSKPLDVTSTTATGSSTTPDSPSISPTSQNCMILSAAVIATSSAPTRPEGYTRNNFANADDTSADSCAMMAFKTLIDASAENPPSWTGATSGGWCSATLALKPNTREPSLSKTLGALALAAAATLDISGSLAKTLGTLTSSSATSIDITGSLSRTLGTLTLSAQASTVTEANLDLAKTLGALTSSATATIDITGASSRTLAALTVSGTATLDISGSLSQTLGSLTLSAAGEAVTAPVEGTVGVTLGALTASGFIFKWDREADENDPSWSAQSGSTPTWTQQSGNTSTWNQQSGSSPTWTRQSGSSTTWSEQ